MKEIQLTLYEIFGYIIPGMITLSAVLIVYWTSFMKVPFSVDAISPQGWWAIAFAAYLIGHLIQAVANLGFMTIWIPTVDLVFGTKAPLALPAPIIAEAHAFALEKTKLPTGSKISGSQTFEICDAFLQQRGNSDTRDIYVYREGFYRGCFISSLLLGAAIILRALCKDSKLLIDGRYMSFSRLELLAVAFVLMGSAILFFQRFRRFGKYLIANSIYSALVLR